MEQTQAKPDLLIVDDDPLISDTLNFVLSRDFNVYVAESRAQVKSLLRQVDHPPVLALIDLGLDHVYILGGSPVAHPHGARQEAMVEQTRHFARDVMPHFRKGGDRD